MRRKDKRSINNIIYPIISLILFITIWYIMSRIINIQLILPTPYITLKQLTLLLGEDGFWVALSHTALRAVLSFTISMLLALVLAIFSRLFKSVYYFFSPIIIISRAVPTMSVILLSLIWFTSSITPMFISLLIIFPMLYAQFYSSFSSIDADLIQMSTLYRVSKGRMVTKFFIPYILPSYFDSVRSAVSLNLKLIIAAEVLAQTRNSMGVMMQRASIFLDTPQLIAWTVSAIIISYLLELFIALLKKVFVRWQW